MHNVFSVPCHAVIVLVMFMLCIIGTQIYNQVFMRIYFFNLLIVQIDRSMVGLFTFLEKINDLEELKVNDMARE